MLDTVAARFAGLAPRAEFWSIRVVNRVSESIGVRQGVVTPPQRSDDFGAMVTVIAGGGIGYAATSDVSDSGLRDAGRRACAWAQRVAHCSIVNAADWPRPTGDVTFETRVLEPWTARTPREKLELLSAACAALDTDSRIVDRSARLWHVAEDTLLVTSDGASIAQRFRVLVPGLTATANEGGVTQRRSLGDRSARQGGLETLADLRFEDAAGRIADQAVALLSAPECPSGPRDLLLAPDQMILQIHESIGHPLELDRILGDERNYAGTSFVTAGMFGSYRYGSEHLNVTFDPTREGELATYAYDDCGQRAEKVWIIRDGILERGLGGSMSERRSGVGGCASARATNWNRPPIDRMANLNVECGDASFADMVAGVERGVYMETNCSWSIDDSRNKFQFGCEWAREIVDGELGRVVRNPGYRGISATFWRNLARVGDQGTFEVMGTPYCGKGEPNQMIRVGHASPACLFAGVEVFGGAS